MARGIGMTNSVLVRLYEAERFLKLYAGVDKQRLEADRRTDEMAQMLHNVLAHLGQPAGSVFDDARAAVQGCHRVNVDAEPYEQRIAELQERIASLESVNGRLQNENQRLNGLINPYTPPAPAEHPVKKAPPKRRQRKVVAQSELAL